MMLVWLIVIPIAAGLVAWPVGNWKPAVARWLCLAAMAIDLLWVCVFWAQHGYVADVIGRAWLAELNMPWIASFGISFHLGIDGLSLLLVALTSFLGIVGVASSWNGITKRVGFYHFNMMWLLAALIGVFLALDLFLFYFFWELMLVPLYLLIGIWGHENRIYATIKFFIFTQAGSLLMLLAIVALYFIHGRQSGTYTFDYLQLLGTYLPPNTAMWLMLGFFAAFAVKLPAVGVHSWLPDAHTEAPTAGSVYLAGLVLKAGAYGLLRFLVPLFPDAAAQFAPVAMTLAVVGILYGAIMAFAQSDLKRLVAYTSVSHMGYVLLGVFAWNSLALQGVVIVILAHALSTGALFILVGAIGDRLHTRDMARMGGLWAAAPRMGGAMTFFALASLGLPGLANFVGEFLVLLGTFQVNRPMAIVAALGMVVSVIYSLWMIQKVFHGKTETAAIDPQGSPAHHSAATLGNEERPRFPDLDIRESVIVAVLIVGVVWIGVYPSTMLKISQPAVERLMSPAPNLTPKQTALGGGTNELPIPVLGANSRFATRNSQFPGGRP